MKRKREQEPIVKDEDLIADRTTNFDTQEVDTTRTGTSTLPSPPVFVPTSSEASFDKAKEAKEAKEREDSRSARAARRSVGRPASTGKVKSHKAKREERARRPSSPSAKEKRQLAQEERERLKKDTAWSRRLRSPLSVMYFGRKHWLLQEWRDNQNRSLNGFQAQVNNVTLPYKRRVMLDHFMGDLATWEAQHDQQKTFTPYESLASTSGATTKRRTKIVNDVEED